VKRPIHVLLVDDSPTVLAAFSAAFSASDEFVLLGAIDDSRKVLSAVTAQSPDVLVMDLDMPHLDGAEVTQLIMEQCPTPILIVTSIRQSAGDGHFRALAAGAVDILGKDRLVGIESNPYVQNLLYRKVRIVAGVTVFRRSRENQREKGVEPSSSTAPTLDPQIPESIGWRPRILAIGASTGGPPAIQALLASFEDMIRVPVVIVQHMSEEFMPGFISWFASNCRLPVVLATEGLQFLSGTVYVAPGDRHLTVDGHLTAHTDSTVPINGCRPAIDRLFASLADSIGRGVIGVLLTGMGRDGALGLKTLHGTGAITIAQNEATSAVYGMPGEAVRMAATSMVLPLEQIGPTILELLDGRRGRGKT